MRSMSLSKQRGLLRALILAPALAAALSFGVATSASAANCIGGPCGADSVSVSIVDGRFSVTSVYGGMTCTETVTSGGTKTHCYNT
jgi:hypothetical protein